ncbi:MAG: hypothetical protein ACM3SY_03095 [Candidatus Omnitrophota bacterium]
MIKKAFFILTIMAITITSLHSQTLTQIGFIIKKALPEKENFIVLYPDSMKDQMEKEAQNASLIIKKKFQIYGVKAKSDIPRVIDTVDDMKSPVIIVIANSGALNSESIKYLVQKVALKNVPVTTNRAEDTKEGALLAIIEKGPEQLETHLSRVAASALKIRLPQEFLSTCIMD